MKFFILFSALMYGLTSYAQTLRANEKYNEMKFFCDMKGRSHADFDLFSQKCKDAVASVLNSYSCGQKSIICGESKTQVDIFDCTAYSYLCAIPNSGSCQPPFVAVKNPVKNLTPEWFCQNQLDAEKKSKENEMLSHLNKATTDGKIKVIHRSGDKMTLSTSDYEKFKKDPDAFHKAWQESVKESKTMKNIKGKSTNTNN